MSETLEVILNDLLALIHEKKEKIRFNSYETFGKYFETSENKKNIVDFAKPSFIVQAPKHRNWRRDFCCTEGN